MFDSCNDVQEKGSPRLHSSRHNQPVPWLAHREPRGVAGAAATDPGATRDQLPFIIVLTHQHLFLSPVSLCILPASFMTSFAVFLHKCCLMFSFYHSPVVLLLAEKLLSLHFHLFTSLCDHRQ